MPNLALSGDAEADKLLSKDPLALVIGMVLDQQVPLEWAFSAPRLLKERLGGRLDVAEMAAMDPDELVSVFCARPALHRFPAANAKRVESVEFWAEERSKGLFATSRVSDDGMIDPRDTRTVLGIALSACHSNVVAGTKEFGTWRM